MSDAVGRRFWEQTGIPVWQLLAGDVPVHKLAEAQVAVRPEPRNLPSARSVSVQLPRPLPPTADDEAAILEKLRVPVDVPAPRGLKRKNRASAPDQPCPATDEGPLLPAVATTDLQAEIEAIETGDHGPMTGAQFESEVSIDNHWLAADLTKASQLTRWPRLRARYEKAAASLLSPPPKLFCADYGYEFPADPDDALLKSREPNPIEKEAKPYRDWVSQAMETKNVPRQLDSDEHRSMNHYSDTAAQWSTFPSVDELVDGDWKQSPIIPLLGTMTVPANPEGLSTGHGYQVRGIGHLKIADYEIEAGEKQKLAKRCALASFNLGGFDPFGPQELGGMPAPVPPPSFEMKDMLKRRPQEVAKFRTFTSLGPAAGIYFFIYDERVPPLRAVPGMLTTTALFYQRGANLRPYANFPFTNRLEYAGPYEHGPLFAPIGRTPQAIADNDHMRAYIAPVSAAKDETTDFLVRVRPDGTVVECIPVQNRVAVAQVFPKHRKASVHRELEKTYFNRLLPIFFPPSQSGMGRPWNIERLLQQRPCIMSKKEAKKTVGTFTVPLGANLVQYNYNLGRPTPKPECPYTLALITAVEHYNRCKDEVNPIRRPIDPLASVGVIDDYLAGKGLLLTGGWGAPDPWSVNLNLQTLKTGTHQKKSDLLIFPEIVGGKYPPPQPKDKNGKPLKRREGSSSDRRRMTRAEYRAELLSIRSTVRRDSEDAQFLDEVLTLIRKNKDTTSDRWRIIRWLIEHDTTADPTPQMTQNNLRRFSMLQKCRESCEATVHALYELVRTGTASIETLPAGPRYAHELHTRELIKAPYLRRFTYYVMFRGGEEKTYTAGNNSQEAWAHKTVYTARKLEALHRLLRDFSNRLFHARHEAADDLRAEIAEIQEKSDALEHELLAGLPLPDTYAQKLVDRAKAGRL